MNTTDVHISLDQSAGPASPRRRWDLLPFDAVRIPIAALLLAAAWLKMQEMFSPYVQWPLLQVLVVQAEWFLALWLLSGVFRRAAWGVTTITFIGFTGFSLYRAAIGAESCGCFGVVQVNPWITTALDLTVLALLAVSMPKGTEEPAGQRRRWIIAVTAMLAVAGGAAAGHRMLTWEPGRLAPDGQILGDAHYVDLVPQEWIGHRFGLLDHIDIGQDLAQGRWSIMFYSHLCPTCHDAVEDLVEAAPDHPDQDMVQRIVLVELPPHGPMPYQARMRELFRVGQVSASRHWFMRTPTVVYLEDGVVTDARSPAVLQLPSTDDPAEDYPPEDIGLNCCGW